MTSQASGGWRRVLTGSVAAGALAVWLLMAVAPGTAHADVLDDVYNQAEQIIGPERIRTLSEELEEIHNRLENA